ncbi:MAG: hypothetical protein RLZZ301_1570 [Bacteroidota bacterium]
MFSMRWASVGLFAFLAAIGAATFIESLYGIQAAKLLVYNAAWFEGLLLFLALSLISNIVRYKMLVREKIGMLLFHVAFLIILAGAAVTRFVSFEGLMVIREGKSSDFIYTADPYLLINAQDISQTKGANALQAWKCYLSEITNNNFEHDVKLGAKTIQLRYKNFQSNCIDSLVINQRFSSSALELVTDGMRSTYLSEGEVMMVGQVPICFEMQPKTPGIELKQTDSMVLVRTAVPLKCLPMSEMKKVRQSGQAPADSLYKQFPLNEWTEFKNLTLYIVGNQQVVFKRSIAHARKEKVKAKAKNAGKDYLTIELSDGKATKTLVLEGGKDQMPKPERFAMNGVVYQLEYGSIQKNLPFRILCRDFQLDKYPGSMSPSSFASELSIIDPRNHKQVNKRVFMNNVIDYDGYRFFQSSYELDNPQTPENEEGTKLSVNYDWWGTNITYFGYLLMSIAMILSLFAPVGRFRWLNEQLKKSSAKANLIILFFGLLTYSASAQTHPITKQVHHEINEAHADELASMLVLDYEGRVVPFHTLADQLTRKLARANSYKDLNAVQFILSMHMYPAYWMHQPVVQVPTNLRGPLHLNEFASALDLSGPNQAFKWLKEYQEAHQKLESKRSEYDKKLIKLNEKYEVLNNIFTWQFMRVVPKIHDNANAWYVPLSMELGAADSSASKSFLQYLNEVHVGSAAHNESQAIARLKQFKKYQRKIGAAVAPSAAKVAMEISYNKMEIFKHAYQLYLSIGLLLMFVFFTRIFTSNQDWTKWPARILVALLSITFVYHGAGVGMRWAISGHAPWSNGYEAVVFIAWITLIAGFVFSRKNAVALAGAAILASLMLFVTEMNLMDPEITPLVPVLKSYWLMIHVAIITASYGFLGLACILGFVNLILYIVRSHAGQSKLNTNIKEITYISEMTMTIGVYMLTIGTFLGGVWANESWGRYWGWDPKETWALVSVLTYAVILHLRLIPGLQSRFLFNVVSFWGYASILFTFFGVNFMLVGLHSYAQGEGLNQFPTWLSILTICFILFTALAAWRNKRYEKKQLDSILGE